MHLGRLGILILAPISVLGAPVPVHRPSSSKGKVNVLGIPDSILPLVAGLGLPLSGFVIGWAFGRRRTADVVGDGQSSSSTQVDPDTLTYTIKDSQGKEVQLTHTPYSQYLRNVALCLGARMKIFV